MSSVEAMGDAVHGEPFRRQCVTTSLSWARQICAGFGKLTLAITITSGRIGHWTKMHQSLAKFSESEASNHTPSLADFTTTTPELKFSVGTYSVREKHTNPLPGFDD
jgi:hypothetical protein